MTGAGFRPKVCPEWSQGSRSGSLGGGVVCRGRGRGGRGCGSVGIGGVDDVGGGSVVTRFYPFGMALGCSGIGGGDTHRGSGGRG